MKTFEELVRYFAPYRTMPMSEQQLCRAEIYHGFCAVLENTSLCSDDWDKILSGVLLFPSMLYALRKHP